MKRTRTIIIAIAAIALAALGAAQIGGVYDMSRNTAEASGGTSVSGQYTLFSTVHQPIVQLSAPSTGGSYSLTSGFLSAGRSPQQIGDVWVIR